MKVKYVIEMDVENTHVALTNMKFLQRELVLLFGGQPFTLRTKTKGGAQPNSTKSLQDSSEQPR